jgi:hypothetical protein
MASRFVGEDLFRCIHLPIRFHELAAAGGRFHLKPLPPLLSGDGSFYLVAIGENHVRVFQGTHHTVTELHEKSLPTSLHEALSAEPSNGNCNFTAGKRFAVYQRPEQQDLPPDSPSP